MAKGFSLNFKPLEILSEQQVEEIQKGIIQVLGKTGVKFEHKTALKTLESNGCQVDFQSNLVKFPPELISECISRCSKRYKIKARDSQNDIDIDENQLYFGTDPGMQMLDIETGIPRIPTRKEFYDAIRIYDSLENFHVWHPNSPNTTFQGVLPYLSTIETYAARTRLSSKINRYACDGETDIFCIQISKLVGAHPIVGTPHSPPLTWGTDSIDTMLRAINAGFPVIISNGDVYGASGPVTLAGSLVHGISEILSGIIFAQIVKPGTPLIALSFTSPQNMRSGAPAFGNIGVGLHDAGFNQIMRCYGIPRGNLEPGLSSSKMIDFQNACERTMLGLISALSGCNLLFLHGGIYGEISSHPLQAILDDDIAGMIARFREGIKVNEETLAIDLINQVGPLPGFYLDKTHTRKNWKNEQYLPKSFDMSTPAEWVRSGKSSCIDHAKERMNKIIDGYEPRPLEENIEAEIERIILDAQKHFEKKK